MFISQSNNSPFKRWLTLLGAGACVALIWLVVLPRLSQLSKVRAHLQNLEDQQIDPSAMYYTELDSMERVLRRFEGDSDSARP